MNHQGRAQARRLAVMAVAAVLLGTVVAASISGGPPPGDPRASFTFSVENDTVLVRHFGGDTIDGSDLAVESGTRGQLGTFDGSDGAACESNVSRVKPGSVCRVPGGTHEQLYVVWEGTDNRSLILARRGPDPTPTVVRTSPPATGTASPTGTRADTPTGTAAGTPTATSAGTSVAETPTATSESTPTGTPTPTPVPTPTSTRSPEPNTFPTPTPTATNATSGG